MDEMEETPFLRMLLDAKKVILSQSSRELFERRPIVRKLNGWILIGTNGIEELWMNREKKLLKRTMNWTINAISLRRMNVRSISTGAMSGLCGNLTG